MSKVANLGKQQRRLQHATGIEYRRNDALFDIWSITHLLMGVLFGWLINPFWAVVLLVLWEPLEILILSPLLKRYFNIDFGYESLRNSLSDIFFDILGVIIGAWILGAQIPAPFHLL